MTEHKNNLGQAIGFPTPNWQARKTPGITTMLGQYCRLEAINIEKHANDLYDAYGKDTDLSNWTYLPYSPFSQNSDFIIWLEKTCLSNDPLFHAVIDLKTERAIGIASYLRINPKDGVIEVGHIHFSPLMQRTPISTEAMYLMMKRVFDELGYRRYEWKCDSLNSPSYNAAKRLGFTHEGIFRQLLMYKGRNRDTAWFSIIDSEWPELKKCFEAWLSPDNFDTNSQQKKSLQSFR